MIGIKYDFNQVGIRNMFFWALSICVFPSWSDGIQLFYMNKYVSLKKSYHFCFLDSAIPYQDDNDNTHLNIFHWHINLG